MLTAAREVEYWPCTEVIEKMGHTGNMQQFLLLETREITKRNED